MKQLAACLMAGAILIVSGSMASAQDARAFTQHEYDSLGRIVKPLSPEANPPWDIDAMNRQIDLTNVIIGTEADGGFCSGTIISIAKRLILTAAHCVNEQIKTEEIEVEDPETGEISKKVIRKRLSMEIIHNRYANFQKISSDRYVAKIVASNRNDDVAILQVIDETWKPLAEVKLAPDDWVLRRGQKMFCIANPGVTFDNSLTEGIISNTERTLTIDGVENQYFQFSAAIMPGSSGGSVLDEFGRIIGTVSAGVRGSAIGFGAPVSKTKTMLRNAGFGDVAGWPSKPLDQPKAGR